MSVYYLDTAADFDVEALSAGDTVYLSGSAFTCRSRLHRWVFDEGNPLPESLAGRRLLIHAGPIVVRENDIWRLVSFMPTSSIRFEKWGARSVDRWGLRMIVGKTTMGPETTAAMVRQRCVHVSPQCVSPNLWLDSITVEGVDLLDELGSIEAPWRLSLDRLGPFVVDIDCAGNNLFDRLDPVIEQGRQKAYRALGIPEDFTFTKLY